MSACVVDHVESGILRGDTPVRWCVYRFDVLLYSIHRAKRRSSLQTLAKRQQRPASVLEYEYGDCYLSFREGSGEVEAWGCISHVTLLNTTYYLIKTKHDALVSLTLVPQIRTKGLVVTEPLDGIF